MNEEQVPEYPVADKNRRVDQFVGAEHFYRPRGNRIERIGDHGASRRDGKHLVQERHLVHGEDPPLGFETGFPEEQQLCPAFRKAEKERDEERTEHKPARDLNADGVRSAQDAQHESRGNDEHVQEDDVF